MRIALAAVVMLVGLLGNVADAGFVYFRGNLPGTFGSNASALNLPANRTFEALIETSGANTVVGGYIVFLGKDFKITAGSLTIDPTDVVFSGMSLSTPNNGSAVPTGYTASFSFSNPVAPNNLTLDSQVDLNKLIGVTGGVLVTGSNATYTGSITAVPEPTSMALVGLAAVGAGAYRRFRRKPAAK